jgi:general secretion pathway protein N
LRLWHFVLFGVLLTAFGLALAPVSLLAPVRAGGFTYERAAGAVFDARLINAKAGTLALGDIAWRFEPASLLALEVGGSLTASGGAAQGQGQVRLGLNDALSIQSDRVTLRGFLHLFAPEAPPGIGQADFEAVTLAFAGGRCARAEGRASLDLEAGAAQRLGAPPLNGGFSCDGADARLRLTGEEDGLSLDVQIWLAASGQGRWQAAVRPATPAQAALLGQAERKGQFQWRP